MSSFNYVLFTDVNLINLINVLQRKKFHIET